MSNSKLEGVRYSRLVEPLASESNRSILIAAEFAGSANCLAPVARYQANKGASVFFQTKEPAESLLGNQFKREDIEPSDLPDNIRWVLVSGGEHLDFEIGAILRARAQSPDARVAV